MFQFDALKNLSTTYREFRDKLYVENKLEISRSWYFWFWKSFSGI